MVDINKVLELDNKSLINIQHLRRWWICSDSCYKYL